MLSLSLPLAGSNPRVCEGANHLLFKSPVRARGRYEGLCIYSSERWRLNPPLPSVLAYIKGADDARGKEEQVRVVAQRQVHSMTSLPINR